jgi:hypothetical protein
MHRLLELDHSVFVLGVEFGHGLHLFMLNQPSRWVANAQLPLQCLCGQAGFGLADQVDRQEPDRQCQVSALRQSAKFGTERPSIEISCGRQREVGNAPLGRSGNSESPEASEPVPVHPRIAPRRQTAAEMRAKISQVGIEYDSSP